MKQKAPTFREPKGPIDSGWGKCLLFIVYSFYTCLSRLSIAKKPFGEAVAFTAEIPPLKSL